jgi:alpha-beta hydrolase superfamily lysophospholipase
MINHEGFFKGDGGARLFFQSWSPKKGEPKGTLTITHGQGEHSECYLRVAQALLPLSWRIIAWDLRGHGRSEGERGNAPSFDTFVRDYECFLAEAQSLITPKTPVVHLGHSMGGLIHLKYALSSPEILEHPHVLSSPFLGLNFPEKVTHSGIVANLIQLIPKFNFGISLSAELCTRDPKVQEEFLSDPLRHAKLAGHLVVQAIEAMDMVKARAAALSGPLLLMIPEKDPIVDSEASRKFFAAAGSAKKIKKEYLGRRHEIFNDLGREEVFADLIEFLKATK